MLRPLEPPNEPARLAALHALDVLDTPPEERFDRITRLAARVFRVPIVLVSLVDSDRQWFKSAHGLALGEAPRAVSFCAHTILEDRALIVPDASTDPRFADNPLVTGDPNIRFYAGHPLRAPDGNRVGTLCLIDRQPRELGASDLEMLKDLAALVETELNAARLSKAQLELIAEHETLRKHTLVDPVTRLWNRRGIMDVLALELTRAERAVAALGVVLVDIDHFKRINDTHGRTLGDGVLGHVAQQLRATTRTYDGIGRYGGEEFLIVLPGADGTTAVAIAERVRARVAGEPCLVEGARIPVTVSLGVAVSDPLARWAQDAGTTARAADELLRAAQAALDRAKESGRNRVELNPA